MSITFWAPDAPTQQVRPYPDEPNYEETVSTLPELNISNANARVFLRLLGLPEDDCGGIRRDDLPAFAMKAIELLNREGLLLASERPRSDSRSLSPHNQSGNVIELRQGPRCIDFGLSVSQLERYATTFAELVTQAYRGGYDVCWG